MNTNDDDTLMMKDDSNDSGKQQIEIIDHPKKIRHHVGYQQVENLEY